jgi:hypothetical protein
VSGGLFGCRASGGLSGRSSAAALLPFFMTLASSGTGIPVSSSFGTNWSIVSGANTSTFAHFASEPCVHNTTPVVVGSSVMTTHYSTVLHSQTFVLTLAMSVQDKHGSLAVSGLSTLPGHRQGVVMNLLVMNSTFLG